MNGDWYSSQLWFSVLLVVLAFAGMCMNHVNGAQFTIIVGTAATTFGARKVVQHRKDNPQIAPQGGKT